MEKEVLDDYVEKTVTELKLRGSSPRTVESYLFFLNPFLPCLTGLLLTILISPQFFMILPWSFPFFIHFTSLFFQPIYPNVSSSAKSFILHTQMFLLQPNRCFLWLKPALGLFQSFAELLHLCFQAMHIFLH